VTNLINSTDTHYPFAFLNLMLFFSLAKIKKKNDTSFNFAQDKQWCGIIFSIKDVRLSYFCVYSFGGWLSKNLFCSGKTQKHLPLF